jgi:hypothetical protein
VSPWEFSGRLEMKRTLVQEEVRKKRFLEAYEGLE